MEPKPARRQYRFLTRAKHAILWAFKVLQRYTRRGFWQRFVVFITAALVLAVGSMYGIAQWYIQSHKDEPLVLGTSFIPAYAESLGLDAQETMDALINDLGVRHFRLVSYWNQAEPEQGKYDFSLLDWQFAKAESVGAQVTLSLGLRQPRWPECHMPDWAKMLPSGAEAGTWQSALLDYIEEVVNRYKNSPALDSYQLENEYFLHGFGNCEDLLGEQWAFDRDRLVREYDLVKRLDPYTKLIIARSNNALGTPIGEPTPDEFAISVYKRVWSPPIGRYMEYPFPAWYYAFVAGVQKMVTDKDMMIHELQAEAWPPGGNVLAASLEEQNKSINDDRLEKRIKFAEGTGMREVYLWGSEYWYYRLVKLNDPSLWNVAKQTFKD